MIFWVKILSAFFTLSQAFAASISIPLGELKFEKIEKQAPNIFWFVKPILIVNGIGFYLEPDHGQNIINQQVCEQVYEKMGWGPVHRIHLGQYSRGWRLTRILKWTPGENDSQISSLKDNPERTYLEVLACNYRPPSR